MKVVATFTLLVLCSLLARPAAADEVAPALERADLRAHAAAALASLGAPVGAYVAFDPDSTDAFAQVACDDDGDGVVVVSDAMLALVGQVTRVARARPDGVASYAEYLAKNQAPGRRLLPPPARTFDKEDAGAATVADVVGALVLLVAPEVERLRAGDLVCSHPTATTESGDAVWTAAERSAATVTARSVYPANATTRDEEALRATVAVVARRGERAKVDLLAFFAAFEASNARSPARVVPSYMSTHPHASARLAAAKAAIANANAAASP